MSITNEDLNEFNSNVVRLVEESTNLVNEIAGQKQRFDDKLAAATTKASEASASATDASNHRASAMNADTSANSHASRAELAALRAEEVSGLDTVEQAVSQALADGGAAALESSPGKIPLANSKGKISSDWLDWDVAATAIVLASGGRLEIIKDALGNAHLFGVWPIQAYEQLQIPDMPFTGPIDVFRRSDGTYRSECRIAIHKSVNVNGATVSRAGLAPYVSLNFDEFKAKASELAGGFVLLDVYHDAFINWQILSILANGGQQPRGNTEWGRSHDAISEIGRRVDGLISNDRSGNGATLTGSGPDSWRHDGTPFGVSDWVGSVWEWTDGLKMVDGQFYVAEYTGQQEAQWAATGRYINEGHVFSMTAPPLPISGNQVWGLFTKSADYDGHELLQKLFIEPIDCTKVLNGRFYYNTDGERLPFRRGGWYGGGSAGPVALSFGNPRSFRSSNFGGRLAFVS